MKARGRRKIMVDGAEVAEQADALRSGRSAPCGRVSSNLTFGTRERAPVAQWIERYPAEVEVRGSNPLWRTIKTPYGIWVFAKVGTTDGSPLTSRESTEFH